jgi:hypothetical protein
MRTPQAPRYTCLSFSLLDRRLRIVDIDRADTAHTPNCQALTSFRLREYSLYVFVSIQSFVRKIGGMYRSMHSAFPTREAETQ